MVVGRGDRNISKTRAVRQAFWAIAGVALCLISMRALSDLRRSHERERLIRGVVKQYSVAVTTQKGFDDNPELKRPWPTDFLLLEKWLAVQVYRKRPPFEIRRRLLDLERLQPPMSPSMQWTLARWYEGLERWSQEWSVSPSVVGEDALRRGRQRFIEAQGYSEIGRKYDAVVLYLWAANWLIKSIETGQQETEYPEALYLLGDIYLSLRHGLPENFHGEQLLTVCSDLYPNSIWASRANAARHTGGG